MQKMKSGLMMVCLTVLLSCAALMMNTPTANAMTMQDLCGDYRITGEDPAFRSMGCNDKGCIVSFVMEDGAFIGKQKDVTGKLTGHHYITNAYIANGAVQCTLNIPGLRAQPDCWIKIYNNGQALEIINNEPSYSNEKVSLSLQRI